ncbi:hypothetical protein ACJMK2_037458 [Sinanodonta woodiana]|uniref:Uncharacterized protein n=1 Tax=Sinanodonta woodiana TaxID=1069815 RepID=A0ABD3WKE2_SINWO
MSLRKTMPAPQKRTRQSHISISSCNLVEDSIMDTASELEALVTFEFVDQGTEEEKKKRKLMSSDGYSYTLMSEIVG